MSDNVVDREAYERSERIYEASQTGWRRDVTDLMSDQHGIFHWCMVPVLAMEGLVLAFLAVWPLWCAVPLFFAALGASSMVNEAVAYWAWRKYDRLRTKAFTGKDKMEVK